MHSIMRAAFSQMNRLIGKIAHIADFQELKNKVILFIANPMLSEWDEI